VNAAATAWPLRGVGGAGHTTLPIDLAPTMAACGLGAVLLAAGIGLVRRRGGGATLLQVWVVAGLLLLVAATLLAWWRLPVQIDRQIESIERRVASGPSGGGRSDGSVEIRIGVGGGSGPGGLGRDALLEWGRYGLVAALPVVAAFPILCDWMISVPHRRAEIATW
jgi:hypothetical protein